VCARRSRPPGVSAYDTTVSTPFSGPVRRLHLHARPRLAPPSGRRACAMKEAFAEVIDSWSDRFEHLRAYSTAGVRPDCDFFFWKITDRYVDPRRWCRPERHAARRLARDAVQLSRDDEGFASTRRRDGPQDHLPRAPVPRASSTRSVESAAVVCPVAGRLTSARWTSTFALGGVRDDPQPHDVPSASTIRSSVTAFECESSRPISCTIDADAARERGVRTERDTPIFVGEGMTVRAVLDAQTARLRTSRPSRATHRLPVGSSGASAVLALAGVEAVAATTQPPGSGAGRRRPEARNVSTRRGVRSGCRQAARPLPLPPPGGTPRRRPLRGRTSSTRSRRGRPADLRGLAQPALDRRA
jgi:hypothetical protein